MSEKITSYNLDEVIEKNNGFEKLKLKVPDVYIISIGKQETLETIKISEELRKNGISVGLGTDGIGSTTTLDMFEEMKTAAYLQKVNTMEPTSINAYQILKMATIEGAKVLGLENEIGTLEVGKKADIIFVKTDKIHMCPENDIPSNIVYSANGADIDTVIVDGKIIMQNRKMTQIDEKEVIKRVKKVAKRLL